ncbi:hypothetical protein LCGC14_2849450 [marine sediment metagenome]|uniref:Uncharacterized protein n=1 Tax=marine sediment metagenome TaxID=412755 RepID=A0A0F8YVN1_9ZZZZ
MKHLTADEQEEFDLAEMLSRNEGGGLDTLPMWVRAVLWRQIQAQRRLSDARGTLAAVRASAVLSVCRIHRGHRDRCDRPACVLGRGILAILEGE